MTFTEAAVEILRLVGKPLHYKKITEIAIERNLLSHVGKTPEITMSSRLATMVRKDRGEAPVVKVKPGVFGLREFSAEVLAEAEGASGHDVAKLPEAEAAPEPERKKAELSKHPGADVFPEEDGDDEPILASIEKGKKKRTQNKEEDGEPRRSKRRRRRGRRDDESDGRDRDGRDRDGRDSRDGRDKDRSSRRGRRSRKSRNIEGDWARQVGDGDSVARDLADAVETSLGRRGKSLLQVAEKLVESGRLSGDAASLAPTVAAAVRGDTARLAKQGAPPRFLFDGDELVLRRQRLPSDAHRAEQDALKAAKKQQEIVRRVFIKRLAELPNASLMELLATWLNALGVVGLRGVRRPTSSGSEFHLAGTLKQGPIQTPLAIVILREGSLSRENVVEARGGLHHYGDARAVWLVALGQAMSGAKEEASSSGVAPVALFDGAALAESMESEGIGLRRWSMPLTTLDFDLLDGLRGPGVETPKDEAPKDDEESSEDDTDGKRKRRRRRRRRGKGDESADDKSGEDDEDDASEAGTGEDSDDKGEDQGEETAEAQPEDADENESEEGDADADSDDESPETIELTEPDGDPAPEDKGSEEE